MSPGTEPLSPGNRLADVVEFFGVQATDDELLWCLPISPNVANYLGVKHGGCALAAVTAAAETWSGRPLVAAWMLLDIESDAVHNAIGNGIVRIYASNGGLLATGTQSFAITRITGPLGSPQQ